MTDRTDKSLAAQYEAYPYPPRDAREEAKRLVVGSPGHLLEIDYWVFGAKRPTSLPLRALFAGGGTGDGTIMLAAQLAQTDRDARVVYLDRSKASLKIAQARAAARGLRNIDFVEGSLLDLPNLGLGLFDYIDCCGVLHHLPDPAEGLQALLSALAPGGGMGLMVYAPHGRTGVYMVQDALRALTPESEKPAARLEVARRVLRHLPASNWLRMNQIITDHVIGGDAGIFDLLLNPRDRAYDVTSFAALLGQVGLAVTCWMEPIRYDPQTYLPDPRLRTLAAGLDPIARAALAEALCGNIPMHVVYCTREADVAFRADPMADTAVPVMRELPGQTLASAIRPDLVVPLVFDGLQLPLPLPRQARAILALVDGKRTVADIERDVAAAGVAPEAFRSAWSELWSRLQPINRLLLAATNQACV